MIWTNPHNYAIIYTFIIKTKMPKLENMPVQGIDVATEEAFIASPEAFLPDSAKLLEEMGPEGFALLPIRLQTVFLEVATALQSELSEEEAEEQETEEVMRTDEDIYCDDVVKPINEFMGAALADEVDEDDEELAAVTFIATEQLARETEANKEIQKLLDEARQKEAEYSYAA